MAYDGTLKFDTAMDTAGFQKDTQKLDGIVKGLSAFKIIEKGFQAISQSIGSAVARYDTLNNFPIVMEKMGYGADESSAAIQKLSKGIEGLPTTLDDIVGNTKQLAIATGSLESGVDTALALNNAFLASGSGSADAARGLVQYTQMLSAGKVDMQSWRTLNETMTYGLQQTAEAFGYTGASAKNDLYEALKSGEITFDEFNAKIISLNSGVGGFAEVAKTSTGGINTAWQNLKTGIVRGTASIITAIDDGLSSTRFKSIENVITQSGKVISSALKGVASVAGFLASNLNYLIPITATFFAIWQANKFAQYAKQIKGVTDATKLLTLAENGNILAKAKAIAINTKDMLVRGGQLIQQGLSKASLVAETIATKANTAATNGGVVAKMAAAVASKAAAAAQWLWNAAMSANPIGLLIIGVTALIAGIIALVSWLNFASEEEKKLQSETEDLIDSSKDLRESMEKSSQTYEDNVASINTNIAACEKMADKLFDLANKANRTASEEARLQVLVDQLNKSMPELNLQYDKQTGQLNKTEEAVRALISAQKDQLLAQAKQARASELAQEIVKQEEELTKLNAKYQEWIEYANENGKSQKWLENKTKDLRAEIETANGAYAESNATLDKYIDEMADSAMQAEETNSAYSDMSKAVTESGETIEEVAEQWGTSTDKILEAMDKESLSLDDWVKSQQERTSEFTNSFKEIPAQFEMSADEMIKTLQTNKERYAEWERNMEELTRQIGPVAAEEFRKLGPEANSAVSEVLSSSERMAELKDIYGYTINEAVLVATEELSKLSPEAQKSVQEILDSVESLEQLKERYGTKITEAGEVVSEEFSKLAPEAQKAVQDMIDSGQSLDELRQVYGTKIGEATEQSAEQLSNDTALSDAATEQVQKMKTAMDESVRGANFSEIGQKVAIDILNGITSADMSTAMGGVASAIESSRGSVVNAMSAMISDVQGGLQGMYSQAQSGTMQMMTSINSEIIARSGTIKASMSSMGSGIITEITSSKSKAITMTSQMMSGMASAISDSARLIKDKAKYVVDNVVSGISPMIEEGKKTAIHMMDGIAIGMTEKSSEIYKKAREIASNIAKTMREELDIHSPSRVMRLIGRFVMNGLYIGMDSMKKKLYGLVESVSDTLTEKLSVSSDISSQLRAMTDLNQMKVIPAAGYANCGATYTTNLVQNITTPKPLSASEITREGQDLLRRSRWQLP